MIQVHLGLGSNLDDPRAWLARGREALEGLGGCTLVAVSSLWQTAPVGGPAVQDDYLNAAVTLETSLSPYELLAAVQAIERDCGRQRRELWGPRTLDIDILLYGDLVSDDTDLILPHPRMHERAFVLEPLAEIAPTARHPILDQTVTELLHRLAPGQACRKLGIWP
ncbi:MAG: 2-amino-4-hydroxy-6-hydroxymethyldihydropteridine diphosphokinase [Geothermobacteraceae bacterium]